MTRFSHAAALGPAFLWLAGCGSPPAPPPARLPAPPPAQATSLSAPPERLGRIVDRYWDERVPLGTALAPQSLADSLALERHSLAEILAIPRDSLDAESRLTYDIFRRQREQDIEGFTYPAELLPINPFGSPPFELARAAADMGQVPLNNAEECGNWLLRIDGTVRWIRQAIANMREGMRRGYTSPRVLMERAAPLLQGLGEDTSANVFYLPLRTMPEAIKDPHRTRLGATLNTAVKDQLLPAIRELHDFIQREYLPMARSSVALSALPLGTPWYESRVRRATDTRLTPNEIHSMGLAEVERIRVRLQSIPAMPPTGDPADLLTAYRDLKVLTVTAMPALFSALPKADFEIREANPLGGAGAALEYRRAAADGATPAILYVSTVSAARSATVEIAEFLQETLPGRHLQSALQQERVDLPKFRRWGDLRGGARRDGARRDGA
ncbi:MAG: DUF885 domain-containing protein, partial [Gammaproteobacteria bacterium]